MTGGLEWIAAPGGRLWLVGFGPMMTRQTCGVGCQPNAPGITGSQAGKNGYGFAELVERLQGWTLHPI